MRNILWLLFLLPLLSYAEVCPNWTEAQREVLRASWEVGKEHDLGYTLMAIAVQESFVGPYLVTVNGQDHNHGSYGPHMITLEFLMEANGYKNIWAAKQDLIIKVLTDSHFSARMSLRKLQINEHLGYRVMLSRYNGVGPKAQLYAERVANNVKVLQKCYKEVKI